MGPQFVLAGIPTVQVGHEKAEDVLVRNGWIPSVIEVSQFLTAINDFSHQKQQIQREALLEGLGVEANWLLNLQTALHLPH